MISIPSSGGTNLSSPEPLVKVAWHLSWQAQLVRPGNPWTSHLQASIATKPAHLFTATAYKGDAIMEFGCCTSCARGWMRVSLAHVPQSASVDVRYTIVLTKTIFDVPVLLGDSHNWIHRLGCDYSFQALPAFCQSPAPAW